MRGSAFCLGALFVVISVIIMQVDAQHKLDDAAVFSAAFGVAL